MIHIMKGPIVALLSISAIAVRNKSEKIKLNKKSVLKLFYHAWSC